MASFSQTSAVDTNGKINVNLLSSEITSTTREATTYTAVDNMKKKAIHSATSYDEFRNFVHCAELKPLKAGEFDQLGAKKSSYVMQQAYSKHGIGGAGGSVGVRSDRRDEWERERDTLLANRAVNEDDDDEVDADATATTATATATTTTTTKKKPSLTKRFPKDGNEFDKAWRKLQSMKHKPPKTLETARRAYFAQYITPERLTDLFRTEMDVNVMGVVIDLFCGADHDVQVAYKWLVGISESGRFKLNVNFLSEEQIAKVKVVLAGNGNDDLRAKFGCSNKIK